MPKLREVEVNSLEEYIVLIGTSGGDHWYRGCGQSSYDLLPSLYRHNGVGSIEEALAMEGELLTWFKMRSVPYLTRQLADDWEQLFFMQHFRIPTRLLDWTESPLVALYLALRNEKNALEHDAAVWVLRPDLWNQFALATMSFAEGAIPMGDSVLDAHAPGTAPDHIRPFPVAVLGTHNSPRVVAQKGVFTVFGANMNPMEQMYAKGKSPADALSKIKIPMASRKPLLESLIGAGVTDSLIFPDLEGLAAEAKRHFGFEV